MDYALIAREATRHHGVLLPELLAAAGVSARQRHLRVQRGEWRRLANGVMVLAAVPTTVEMLATAAIAQLPHGVLSHDTAGWAHGVEGVEESRSRGSTSRYEREPVVGLRGPRCTDLVWTRSTSLVDVDSR